MLRSTFIFIALIGILTQPCLASNLCEKVIGGEWGSINAVVIGNPVGARFPHEPFRCCRRRCQAAPLYWKFYKIPEAPLTLLWLQKQSKKLQPSCKNLKLSACMSCSLNLIKISFPNL